MIRGLDATEAKGDVAAKRLRLTVSQIRVFLDMGNMAIQEIDLMAAALRSVAALIPASWTMQSRVNIQVDGWEADGEIELTAPNGERVAFIVEVKRSGSIPVAFLIGALRDLGRRSSRPVLFVSDYIGPSLRAALTEAGVSFADGTGWVRLTSTEPLVLVTGQGAVKSPGPVRIGAVTRLNGVAASRTIRALATLDDALGVGVRDLATLADVSPGSVSKLLATLAAEGIVDRDARGGVVVVRRRALIHRWIRDYSFLRGNKAVGFYIAPRGIDRALASLATSDLTAALTGSAAARRMLPDGTTSVVPLRLLALYAAKPGDLAAELGLIDAEQPTANVVIAIPQDQRILAPVGAEPTLAPTALVLADLLTLPNRAEAEAEQLMDTLAQMSPAWRG